VFGRVIPQPGRGRSGWCIDLGRRARPRYLFSARGARFTTRETAQAVLDAIRVAVARGAHPQAAVDEFAPCGRARPADSDDLARLALSSRERWALSVLEECHEVTLWRRQVM
jgi:hypothetical protein